MVHACEYLNPRDSLDTGTSYVVWTAKTAVLFINEQQSNEFWLHMYLQIYF